MMERFSPTPDLWKKLSLFDRTVGAIAIILIGLIAVVLLRGNQSPLSVTQYSWRNTNIGAQTQALTMAFNHPVEPGKIEAGLTINPPLAGKTVWQGRRWFYSLTEIPRYGTNYQLSLPLPSMVRGQGKRDFTSVITSRARALVYIGVGGEERGRLILYNITNPQQPQKIILTPKDLTVRQFQIYPQGDRLVFTATDPTRRSGQQNIFTVTTGINNLNTQTKVLPGKLERLWESQDYDNQRIALAINGSMLVIARQNVQNPADAGLWIAPKGVDPRPLGIKADQFIVGPNGDFLAVTQEGGVGLIPLTPNAGAPQFLEAIEQALDFSPNGKELLLTQQNPDFSHSLVIYDLQDRTQREILRGPYPLLSCRFDPRSQPRAYCLQADFIQREGEPVQPEPYLAVINLANGQVRPLLALPNYPEVDLTIAPDGLGLMFDQVATGPSMGSHDLLTNSQRSIVDGRVWLLPLPGDLAMETDADPDPQELTAGFAPRWMP
ncbi:hypothetical protein IQE94_05110 [Synechocystis sp. PCC 7339]|uniref:hypothetical protein n=1 Tax=unclassified Synechocystis TaxID=2640012 RepID=UPI001BAEDE02|nr:MULTISPECIES: hypothetical protein [unclassified Synechocystis]QUS61491.1 hypothetical protein HTZ78_13035 [Synechocystis sp. PCC 7338]UAJ73667.1 hypothetical protein IQE94_05110 [Synechocystis sp. PCC 7339]